MKENQYQSKSDQIKASLYSAFKALQKKVLIAQIFSGIALVLGLLLILILIEQFSYLSSVAKSFTFLASIISATVLYFWFSFRKKETDFDSFHRTFARSQNIDEINYFLDLERDQLADPELVKAAIEKNLSSIQYQNFKQKLNSYKESREQTGFYNRTLKITGMVLLFFIVGGFTFSDATSRAFTFWKTFEKPNPYSFSIKPGNITLEQGSAFSTEIEFEKDNVPKDVTLFVKTDVESEYRSLSMEFAGNAFISIPFNLNNNLEYFVQMDGFRSETYTASVQLRPRFSELISSISPPTYTKLDSTSQSYPFSLIRAYQGSKIFLSAQINKPVPKLEIETVNNSLDTLTHTGKHLFAEFYVTEKDTISFYLEDASGLQNQNNFQFLIEPVIDEYPVVEIIEPATSLELVEPKFLDLIFKATDDFDITRSTLKYELKKAYVNEPVSGNMRLQRPVNGVLQRFEWDLASLELSPLDELTFWVEASDNDGFNGRKTSRSQSITLAVPSLVDYFESLDEKESEIETDLESISESFEEMSEKYKEFQESLKENPNPGYENKRQLEEAQKRQEEVQKKIDELNEKFEEIKKELNENNLLSEETQKAYDELKKLMEEIDDPALREALEMLQQNLDQFTPEQLRQAMEQVEFNEEDFKKRLERTIELFKRLKLMSDLEKLAKSFEDQARQEKELAQNPASPSETENKRREDLEQIEKLREAIDKLSENKSEKNDQQVSEFQKDSKNQLEEDINKEIVEWLEEQKKQQQQGSGQNQQQKKQPNLEQDYQQLANKARNLMQQIGEEEQQINVAGLQYVLYSLLTLSTEQEDLVLHTQATEDRSLAYVEFARDQKNIEQIFNALADSLFELSKSIPPFSNQINTKTIELKRHLKRSLTQMAERSQRNSSVASRQAFGGINDIAFMIANLLEQLQDNSNNGNGNGNGTPQSVQQMLEQMQQMKGNQQQLNEQLQQMINDMQGERLSNDQMERLNQMARQQNEIRKQLQELMQNGGLEGDRAGSELQRMIDEMEDTINDLRGGAVDPTLIERQQNILSRMLDAEKSLQERDEEEKEREGKNSSKFEQTAPPEMTLEELEKQIRSRLNDPNFTKYSPDYQKLIERYFELLKKLQERNIQSP